MPKTTVAFMSLNLDFYFMSYFKICKHKGFHCGILRGKKGIEFQNPCKISICMALKPVRNLMVIEIPKVQLFGKRHMSIKATATGKKKIATSGDI